MFDWLTDVVMLSRIQFAATIMFHYLFPPLTIGLGALLVIMEGTYLKTRNPVYEQMTKFWVKIFALTFGLGVASGIVMEFQFGTNWATYSRFVGDVFGSALAAEGIFAFFLESGFLAILVFGWDKVGPKMHFFSTVMVFLGSIFSAVWIVVANSWMQTPAGFHIIGYDQAGNSFPMEMPFVYDPEALDGIMPRAEITSFWEMVLNPSSVVRILHTVVGCFVLASFVVMSVCGYYIARGRYPELSKRCFAIALVFGAFWSLVQPFLGHLSAEIVAEHQPAKLAAFEGLYQTEEYSPLYLFGIPNSSAERVDYGVKIPGMLSFLVHGNFSEPVAGLDQFPREDWPPVFISFTSYHIMVGLGFYFIGITLLALYFLWRGTLFEKTWLMWVFVFSVILPYIANHTGWIAAEVGRQPWVVYDILRTEHGFSKAVGASSVLGSLFLFLLIYALLFFMYIYLLDRKIRSGPEEFVETPVRKGKVEAEDVMEAVTRRGPGRGHLAEGKEE